MQKRTKKIVIWISVVVGIILFIMLYSNSRFYLRNNFAFGGNPGVCRTDGYPLYQPCESEFKMYCRATGGTLGRQETGSFSFAISEQDTCKCPFLQIWKEGRGCVHF